MTEEQKNVDSFYFVEARLKNKDIMTPKPKDNISKHQLYRHDPQYFDLWRQTQKVALSKYFLIMNLKSKKKQCSNSQKDWHFESQCIPTPLSYYAHQMPKLFLKFGVAVTYITQLGMSGLCFSPNRSLRITSGWFHICKG